MPIVYVLTNKSMPNVVKIGITGASLEQRMRSLDSTGVPQPFECYYAVRVDDAKGRALEQHVHQGLDRYRVRPNREFFSISAENAKSILKIAELWDGEDVTPTEQDEALQVNEAPEAEKPKRKREPSFRFSMLSIPQGAILTFKKDHSITCEVINDTQVKFRGKHTSLSKSANTIVGEMGYNWSGAPGPEFWCWNGETLFKLREQKKRSNH